MKKSDKKVYIYDMDGMDVVIIRDQNDYYEVILNTEEQTDFVYGMEWHSGLEMLKKVTESYLLDWK